MVRKVFSLVFSIALMVLGLYMLYLQLFQSKVIFTGGVAMGIFLFALGGAGLTDDLITSFFKSKPKD